MLQYYLLHHALYLYSKLNHPQSMESQSEQLCTYKIKAKYEQLWLIKFCEFMRLNAKAYYLSPENLFSLPIHV